MKDHNIMVHHGTQLVTARAAQTLAHLNDALLPYKLCLPIAPLAQDGITLADAIVRNIGGWRSLRYGTIARYIRAATLHTNDAPPHTLGGATLKRATGYRLTHALLNHTLQQYLPSPNAHDTVLHDVTLHLRPLPMARLSYTMVAQSIAAGCAFAAALRKMFLPISTLAFTLHTPLQPTFDSNQQGVIFLVELEGDTQTLAQHEQQIAAWSKDYAIDTLSYHTVYPVETAPTTPMFGEHEHLWQACTHTPPHLSLHIPYSHLADYLTETTVLTQRSGYSAYLWGDLGTGMVHITLLPGRDDHNDSALEENVHQTLLRIATCAARLGGTWATEWSLQPPHYAAPLAIARPTFTPTTSSKAYVPNPIHKLTHPDDLACYETDASIAMPTGVPAMVLLPTTTDQVCAIVQQANAHSPPMPIVTRGAGSGLAGGSTPSEGCIILALTRMHHIEIDPDQMIARVQAGAITADIQRAAEQYQLFYPPDPSSQTVSTIGGNIACNAGGPRCLKYGVTADYVLGLTAVLANGQVVHLNDGITGQGDAAGLMHLLIGSEGTLAVITAATLRLVHLPPARRTTLAFFAQLEDACTTVQHIIAAGILPAALELLDDTTLQVLEHALHLGLPHDAGAMLLTQIDGTATQITEQTDHIHTTLRQGGATLIQTAATPAEEALLWKARRSIGPAFAHMMPNKLGEDIVVPVPRIAETVRRIKAIATAENLLIPIFGHAGDGNLHPNILFHARDPEQKQRAWRAAEAIFAVALDVGGTLSGEHGIGTLKRPFMPAAIAEHTLAIHRAIKQHFDPHTMLNPGKVLPF